MSDTDKPRCPLCNFVFIHKRGMVYCTCGESAIDYNSGSEIDLKHTRYLGAIVNKLFKEIKESKDE